MEMSVQWLADVAVLYLLPKYIDIWAVDTL